MLQSGKYLPRCLDSVLSQTFSDFEAICVNDGSPDSCGEILADYAAKDSRIKILTQQNQGLSMARNNGLKLARGNFIYFLDSDDFIHPQLLEITHALALQHQADMVSFAYIYHKSGEQQQQTRYNPDGIPVKVTSDPFFHGTSKGKNTKFTARHGQSFSGSPCFGGQNLFRTFSLKIIPMFLRS